jgi:hypothetical protein
MPAPRGALRAGPLAAASGPPVPATPPASPARIPPQAGPGVAAPAHPGPAPDAQPHRLHAHRAGRGGRRGRCRRRRAALRVQRDGPRRVRSDAGRSAPAVELAPTPGRPAAGRGDHSSGPSRAHRRRGGAAHGAVPRARTARRPGGPPCREAAQGWRTPAAATNRSPSPRRPPCAGPAYGQPDPRALRPRPGPGAPLAAAASGTTSASIARNGRTVA